MTEPELNSATVVRQIDSFVRDQFGAPDPS